MIGLAEVLGAVGSAGILIALCGVDWRLALGAGGSMALVLAVLIARRERD